MNFENYIKKDASKCAFESLIQSVLSNGAITISSNTNFDTLSDADRDTLRILCIDVIISFSKYALEFDFDIETLTLC